MKLMARAIQKIPNFDKIYIIQFNLNCHKKLKIMKFKDFFPNSFVLHDAINLLLNCHFQNKKNNLEFRYLNNIKGYQLNSWDYWIVGTKNCVISLFKNMKWYVSFKLWVHWSVINMKYMEQKSNISFVKRKDPNYSKETDLINARQIC